MLRWISLLVIVLGGAVYSGILPLESIKRIGAKPQIMYRWVDARGGIHYGNEYPQGVKAEIVQEGNGTVNVVPATKVVEPPKFNEMDAATLQHKMLERTIEGAGK